MLSNFDFNADLVSDIARRKVVVFVGAGASRWAKPHSGNSFKDWPEFLKHASEGIPKKTRKMVLDRVAAKDYLIASELLKSSLSDKWPAILASELQQAADTSALHKAIVSLEQRVILTTNFDKLLENAWNETKITRYPRVISKIDQHALKLFRDDETYWIFYFNL